MLLQAEEIEVTFGGHRALVDVSIDADSATVTGLIGPNGAGKTTCFNVLNGLLEPDRGRVIFDGRDVSDVPAFRRSRLGLARTFQRLEVFGSLTVFENVLVAAEIRKRWARSADDTREEASRIVELVGLAEVADRTVDSIPTGQARLVELGRALAVRPKLVLLDEPSSGLDEDETEQFGELLLTLARQGMGVLLVEHDVDLVMQVCSRIHVLDFGTVIARGTPSEIRRDPRVQRAYLGADPGGAGGKRMGLATSARRTAKQVQRRTGAGRR